MSTAKATPGRSHHSSKTGPRTDLSLTGLLVAPGRHHVTLVYRDPWVTAGLVVSLAGFAVLLAFTFGIFAPVAGINRA